MKKPYRHGSPARRTAIATCLALIPALSWAQHESQEIDQTVVVSATRSNAAAPLIATPVQVLAGQELALRRQGSLGETLAGLPGVHLDNFGAGTGRPVIRGQTLPRIEILSDGAPLFDAASVSPDHAVTTDPLLLDSIEIIRGPAAVLYGGNALSGAVNLIDSKIPKAIPARGVTGSSEIRYGTGDDEKTVVGRVTAGAGQFALHAEGSRHRANDYAVPGSYGSSALKDSFGESSNASVGASWITAKGYIGAAFTRQNATYGLPGHSHANGVCHNHQDHLHCAAHGSYEDPFGGYDDRHTAFIRLRSERAEVRADYDDPLPGLAKARLRLSYTDYTHDEVDGVIVPARYSNKAYDARFELTHKPLFGFSGTFGGQYTDITFGGLNVNTLHQEIENALYFNHGSRTNAAFLTERRSFGAVDVQLGVRKEWRKVGVTDRDLTWLVQDADSEPLSASLGALWNLSAGYALALDLGRTERAPSLRELYAEGNNLATNSFELGLAGRSWFIFDMVDRPDVIEKARSVNLTLRKTQGATTLEVGVYHQDIDDYIHATLLDQDLERGHRLLVYNAEDASFSGIDGQVSHRFDRASTLTLFGDYVRARLRNSDEHLPRISPGRLGARYGWTAGPVTAEVEAYRTFAQNRYAAYETRTGGYNMLNASVTYRLDAGWARNVELYLRGTNLTNELAYSHTSFVKQQSPLRGRNIVLGLRHQF